MANKAYLVRLYPNKEQAVLINKTIGCCRKIYNLTLNERSEFYKENKADKAKLKSHKYKTEKDYKEEFPYLTEVSSRALQQSRRDLLTAFTNFFKGRASYPVFKSFHKSKLSYREPQVSSTSKRKDGTEAVSLSIRIEENKISLLKLGLVKFRGLADDFRGEIKSVTVSKDRTGKYYCSILTEQEQQRKFRTSNNKIGIDLGLSNFVTTSDGLQIYPLTRTLLALQKKVVKQQKHLSRKKKGSSRRNKCRIKLAVLYKKLSNIQKHFFYHLANLICSENQTIKLETLGIKDMLKNRKRARSIHRISWFKFIEILKQKAVEFGSEVIQIDRYYPSSKTCSNCKKKKDDLKITDRTYVCSCGLQLDRDLNAAINILNYKSDESSDYKQGEAVRLTKKYFDFHVSSFVELLTKNASNCYV